MKKILLCIGAAVLALLVGMAVVVDTVLILPTQYDDVYLAELADKYARLRSLDDENKVIIIGGSSVSFGIDSRLMEEELGMPVVNFGMYGPLGTTVMLDLTRGHINPGDIVILAPETDSQTMSMEFNGEGMWQCCDNDFTMLFKIRLRNWDEMLGSFWTYATQKWQYYNTAKPETDGVYSHDSFNEYGDIAYARPENIMENGYDDTVPIDLSEDTVEDEFLDYLNSYIYYCKACGAQVYYTWPPMNELAVQQDLEGQLQFATYMRENLRCTIMSDITDYIMDADCFYDTNYHMNDAGVTIHTLRVLQDIENVIGDGSLVTLASDDASSEPDTSDSASADMAIDAAAMTEDDNDETADAEALPAAATLPEGSSEDADCFTYDTYNEGLVITGVTEAAADRTSLEIPWRIDDQLVLALGENALSGCTKLTDLYIQANIERIMQGAFDGCPTLTSIHIDNPDGANILIPGVSLFDNVPNRTQVYIPQEYYGTYVADYFWGNYIERLNAE